MTARGLRRRQARTKSSGLQVAAMLPASAEPSPISRWTFLVQRLREELRVGEGYRRTVGSYQVLHDGAPAPGLSGMTIERQGPGDNSEVGKQQHRCIAAGSYPINSHSSENYKTVGYKTSGAHPRPALEIGSTGAREGILIHPADGYGSTIGCINLAGEIGDADADIEWSDSVARVIDVIDDLKRFVGGSLPMGDGVAIPAARLMIMDAGGAVHVAAAPLGMIAAGGPQTLASPAVIDCDVVIQAGHEDTPDDKTGGTGPLGREIEWTPIVGNEAVRLLRLAGVNAVKETAYIKATHQKYRCKLALFLHFDDPGGPAESGPSVGYSHPSDAPAAEAWKTLYRKFFPFNDRWRDDNFTEDEHYYYGFKYTATSDAEFLIEFGDLHSLRQAQWLKPRLTWLGALVAHYVSARSGMGGVPKPSPFVSSKAMAAAASGPQPVGPSVPFTTKPSPSGNAYGSSSTSGLNGTRQAYDDGSVIIEASESLRAERVGGWHGTLTAVQRRNENAGVIIIEQSNYSYHQRELPVAVARRQVSGFPAAPSGYSVTPIRAVKASQFGKNDHQDEGTGSPDMGLVQTNSEVFGASIKMSAMVRVFGPGWRKSDKRLAALIEVLFGQNLVRVPLVDIGPHEDTYNHIYPEVDLTWACDQFLGTQGMADVHYRVLVPV